MPDPPNDQKKRKDDVLDITRTVTRGRNILDIYQEQRDSKGFFDHPGQVCAIFLVRIISPKDFLNFIKLKKVEDPTVSLKRAKGFFSNHKPVNDDVAMIEAEEPEKISLKVTCPITMLAIGVPGRGEHCTHL